MTESELNKYVERVAKSMPNPMHKFQVRGMPNGKSYKYQRNLELLEHEKNKRKVDDYFKKLEEERNGKTTKTSVG